MKRLYSIALLFIFVYIIAGHYLAFTYFESLNRADMEEQLEQDELLQTLRIPKANAGELTYTHGGKEVMLRDKVYDVKNQRIEGDFIVFQCISDDVETELMNELALNIQNNLDSKSGPGKKQSNSVKITLNDYCINMNRDGLPRPSQKAVHGLPAVHFSYFISPISSPPPKSLVC